jgi:hypothetical protein
MPLASVDNNLCGPPATVIWPETLPVTPELREILIAFEPETIRNEVESILKSVPVPPLSVSVRAAVALVVACAPLMRLNCPMVCV